jgi:hypothetical protein
MVTFTVWFVPDAAPLHPVKFDDAAGVSVTATIVFALYTPAVGFNAIVPVPLPAVAVVNL